MKIRTDFVTNSSSSSFSIVLSVETTDGSIISFEEDPCECKKGEIGSVYFKGNLSKLWDGKTKKVKNKYSTVEKLAEFLMKSVQDDYDEDWEEEIAARKDDFIKQLTESASDISDISIISICRNYSARGEFAEDIVFSDEPLCKLARKVKRTTGEEKKVALQKMRDYINTSNGNRQGEIFGSGFDDFRYNWHGDDDALIELSKRLCGSEGPDFCEGSEYQELDLTSGAYSEYVEFDLT